MSNVAVVTGGTRGIGKQIILDLAKKGYNIAFNYRSENTDFENLKQELKEIGVNVYGFKCDVVGETIFVSKSSG